MGSFLFPRQNVYEWLIRRCEFEQFGTAVINLAPAFDDGLYHYLWLSWEDNAKPTRIKPVFK